jgi:polyhydroxyalkanoate synthesis repressor PhaR
MRLIRRYANRKLYDTALGRNVSLEHVAELVRGGEEIRVLDHATARDLTTAKLAQIIFEAEKRSPQLGVERLRQIIREGLPT